MVCVLKILICTIFQGEFAGDQFHGMGLYKHISGMEYEGLWSNGSPIHLSSKIIIVTDKPEKKKKKKVETDEPQFEKLIIHQGVPFKIRIECRNDLDEVIEGRCTKAYNSLRRAVQNPNRVSK